MIEPFKYVLISVLVERDDDGRIVREITCEPASFYTAEQMMKSIIEFEEKLASPDKEEAK